jgi:predicted DNA-binding ribbon-helix-helix protein
MVARYQPSVKRSIEVDGHQTSINIEETFWVALKQIAERDGTTITDIINKIKHEKDPKNLASAVRVFVFEDYLKNRRRT